MPIILSFLLLAGCSSLGGIKLEKPNVTLAGLSVAQMDLFEQRYLVKLRIQNPNDVALPIKGMNFNLDINDKQFARGVTSKAVSIPALGEGVVEVEVVSSIMRIMDQLRALEAGRLEGLNYALTGNLILSKLVPKLPFEAKGELSSSAK